MTRLLLALTILAAAAPGSLSAHHSYAAYHLDQILEIEGVIDEIEWRAPHTLLKVKTDDGRMHIFEWQAPMGLQRRGVQQDTLKAGDRVVAAGNPHREFEQNRILNFKRVLRMSDGWKWPNEWA
jgi:Family of unknown function (DUF6152)